MTRTRPHEVQDRTEWHKSESGCWSLSLGERGCRVRVFQRRPGAVFERITTLPGGARTTASLATTSRPVARQRAEAFLLALRNGEREVERPALTLQELSDRYQQESPAYRQNTPRTRADKRTRVKIILRGLGAGKSVDDLTLHDVARYSELRRQGIRMPDGTTTPPVRERSAQADMVLLRTMLNWATTVKLPDGRWLLESNPLRGMRLPRERNPRRPVATYDRFLKTREAAKELATNAESDQERELWTRLEFALVLAEATGRRIGSIRGLRWEEIDFEEGSILWTAEFDKGKRDQRVPVPQALIQEISRFKTRLRAVGKAWVFRQLGKNEPWNRKVLDDLLRRAEQKAEVEKLKGGLWHPYRRKWATERKDMPISDVMRAGGWRDISVLQSAYLHADDGTMLKVLESPVKLVGRRLQSEGCGPG
jgi:integrase